MIMMLRVTFMLYFLGLTACGMDSGEKYETISKLRALGVESTPLVLKPSTEEQISAAKLLIYAATPLTEDVEFEPFIDLQSRNPVPVNVTINQETLKKTDYAALSIHQIEANVQIPKDLQVLIPKEPGFTKIRYGIRIKSGVEQENIVGNLIIYSPLMEGPSYEPLTVQIASAKNSPSDAKIVNLEAAIENKNSEKIKYGWFVSSGDLKNRRAKITDWRDSKPGSQTLILTARGMKSGHFAFTVQDFQR